MRRAAAAWSLVLAATGAVAWLGRGADGGDLPFFVTAGRRLVSSGWAETYADPAVQAGPLGLAPLGLADALARALGVDALALLALALPLAGAAALLAVLRLVVAGRAVPQAGVLLAAGGLAAILALPQSTFADGHPAQLFVPLLWLVAALLARDGRGAAAGALVGLSAGLETWGLLGVAALALHPRARAALAGTAVAAGVAAVVYAPFALAGSFRMLEYRWTVAEGTLPSLVLEPGAAFPWELRLLQGAAAVAAGVAVALLLRRTSHAPWAALLAVVAVRLLLDPLGYSWYWLALQALVLAGAVELLTSPRFAALLRRRRSGPPRPVPMETT